jgi:hypothetical protein
MATNEDLKEQGNALFTAGKYAEAADVYTQAIAAAGAPSTSTATLFRCPCIPWWRTAGAGAEHVLREATSM